MMKGSMKKTKDSDDGHDGNLLDPPGHCKKRVKTDPKDLRGMDCTMDVYRRSIEVLDAAIKVKSLDEVANSDGVKSLDDALDDIHPFFDVVRIYLPDEDKRLSDRDMLSLLLERPDVPKAVDGFSLDDFDGDVAALDRCAAVWLAFAVQVVGIILCFVGLGGLGSSKVAVAIAKFAPMNKPIMRLIVDAASNVTNKKAIAIFHLLFNLIVQRVSLRALLDILKNEISWWQWGWLFVQVAAQFTAILISKGAALLVSFAICVINLALMLVTMRDNVNNFCKGGN